MTIKKPTEAERRTLQLIDSLVYDGCPLGFAWAWEALCTMFSQCPPGSPVRKMAFEMAIVYFTLARASGDPINAPAEEVAEMDLQVYGRPYEPGMVPLCRCGECERPN